MDLQPTRDLFSGSFPPSGAKMNNIKDGGCTTSMAPWATTISPCQLMMDKQYINPCYFTPLRVAGWLLQEQNLVCFDYWSPLLCAGIISQSVFSWTPSSESLTVQRILCWTNSGKHYLIYSLKIPENTLEQIEIYCSRPYPCQTHLFLRSQIP